MAARPSWSGYLRFNLISVPVQGYSAAVSGGGKIGFVRWVNRGHLASLRRRFHAVDWAAAEREAERQGLVVTAETA